MTYIRYYVLRALLFFPWDRDCKDHAELSKRGRLQSGYHCSSVLCFQRLESPWGAAVLPPVSLWFLQLMEDWLELFWCDTRTSMLFIVNIALQMCWELCSMAYWVRGKMRRIFLKLPFWKGNCSSGGDILSHIAPNTVVFIFRWLCERYIGIFSLLVNDRNSSTVIILHLCTVSVQISMWKQEGSMSTLSLVF